MPQDQYLQMSSTLGCAKMPCIPIKSGLMGLMPDQVPGASCRDMYISRGMYLNLKQKPHSPCGTSCRPNTT